MVTSSPVAKSRATTSVSPRFTRASALLSSSPSRSRPAAFSASARLWAIFASLRSRALASLRRARSRSRRSDSISPRSLGVGVGLLDGVEDTLVGDVGEAILTDRRRLRGRRRPLVAERELGAGVRQRAHRRGDAALRVEEQHVAAATEDREQHLEVALARSKSHRELPVVADQAESDDLRVHDVGAQVLAEGRRGRQRGGRAREQPDACAAGTAREPQMVLRARPLRGPAAVGREHDAGGVGLRDGLHPMPAQACLEQWNRASELRETEHAASIRRAGGAEHRLATSGTSDSNGYRAGRSPACESGCRR